jgi:GNAT superfamily N-acetyltransferase
MAPPVRPAVPADVPRLAEVMARAFDDDPFMNLIAAEGPDRSARIRDGMIGFFRFSSAGLAETWTTEDLAGAAIWHPPGYRGSTLESIRILPALGRLSGWGRLGLVSQITGAMARRHRHYAPGPHMYLMALGVEPGRQGQGIGSALIAPVLERCDRAGLPAYLETSTPGGRRLYERHGFDTVEELTLPGTSTPGWLMLRHPGG